MPTNTTTTDLKDAPGVHRIEVPPTHLPPRPGSGKPRKRGFIWVLFLLMIVGVAAYAVYKVRQPGAIPQQQQGRGGRGRGGGGGGNLGPIPVSVAKAHTASVPVYLNGLGNASAFYTVTVKSRVDGQLMDVNFAEGDFVKEGQVLAQIDPRPYQVQLEQAEGQQARDQALLTNARLDLERYRTLLAQDAVPKQQLDTQVALVAQYEGNLKQDTGNVNNAKLQLTYAKVTAPISGRVGLRLVDPGNIVRAADATGMLVITQLQPIAVLFTIPEDSLPQVIKKVRAGVRLPADAWNRDNSQKLSSGYLATFDNTIDQTTGTSKLKAVFDNSNNELFPNQFVNIRLLVDTLGNQIVVPTVSIQHGQQGSFVYLVHEDSTVEMRVVQTGAFTETDTSIKSGLKVGDQVVIDGTDRLQNGTPVRIRQPGDETTGVGGDGRGRGASGGRGQGGRGGGRGQGRGGSGGGQRGGGSAN
jgi:membrane fusion protein, multidrug efflux system